MKYVVIGKCDGKKVYWNGNEKGWYCNKEYATIYKDVNSADSASIQAECTLTMECVDDITFEKIK